MRKSWSVAGALIALMVCPLVSQSQTIGDYFSHVRAGNTITFKCSGGATVRFELCKADIIRVRMAVPGAEFAANEPYSVVKYDWPAVESTVSDAGDTIEIATGALVVRVNKKPFSLAFYEPDGTTLITRQKAANSMSWNGEAKSMAFERDAVGKTEHFYGCGMHWHHFDLRGLNMKIYQIDPNENHQSLDGSAITVVPYYWSNAGYGMLLHNSYVSFFDFGKADPSTIGWDVTGGELDFYFLKGPSFKTIIRNYCELTGYLEMPPKKALGLTYRGQGNSGYLLPKPVYWTAADYDRVTDEFRARGIPCDIIAPEPGWAVGYGNLIWEKSRYPDPPGWLKRMIDKGFAPNLWMLAQILDPELKKLLEPYCTGNLLDVTMTEGMDAYFDWLTTHFWDLDVLGFKEDTHGIRTVKGKLKSGRSIDEYHNSYCYIWAQGLFDRYKKTHNKRLFVYCTALWTGAQRYPLVAYSDQGVQITWIANSGWTGMAYAPEMYGHKNYKALHAMAFSPYMVHNEWVYGKLPWDDDTEAYEVYLRYVKLHYRLIPYIYSQMWEQHTTGVGPIRPLALEFPDDPQTWSISNQYFYGNNLMVSFDHSKIYLPQGKWTYYWDGRVFEGGRTLTNFGAPPDQLPVFVRAGAILPMMPDMNYIGEKPVDPLILDIYPEGKSEFTLYEDDGITFDYEKGDYCQTRYQVAWDQDAITINIDARHAPGAYRPPARHYLLAIHNGAEPGRVAKDGIALAKKGSEADLNASAAGWSYANGITRVRLADIGKEMRISLGNST